MTNYEWLLNMGGEERQAWFDAEHVDDKHAMTNLEWLYENDRDAIIDNLCCHEICDECAMHKYGRCGAIEVAGKQTFREWLMSEHVDSESMADAIGVTDAIEWSQEQLENANPALVNALKETDSREKLENDIWAGCDHLTMLERGQMLVNVPYDKLLGWLDRQAAITHSIDAWNIERLERERDEWRSKVSTLANDSRYWRDRCAKLDYKSAKRAAAAERLKDARYHTLADYVRAMLGWGHEPHFEDCRDALIDLLTDESGEENDQETPIFTEIPQKTGEEGQKDDALDSREKLEADVRAGFGELGFGVNRVIEWLDRQAAITERECLGRMARETMCYHYCAEVSDLRAKVDELTEQRRTWRNGYELRNAECNEYAAKLEEMERERDYWKLQTDCWADKHKEQERENAKLSADELYYRNAYKQTLAQMEDYRERLSQVMDIATELYRRCSCDCERNTNGG